MKFDVNITGDFHNIKGLRIVQEYYIKVKCGSCETVYPNEILISHKGRKSIKIKEKPHEKETFNLAVQCKECLNIMGILIYEPEVQFEFRKELERVDGMEKLFLSPVNNGKCNISRILSGSAEVIDVDGLILDAVSNQDEIFHNCSFDKRILAEDDHKGRTVDISNFCIEVEQIN